AVACSGATANNASKTNAVNSNSQSKQTTAAVYSYDIVNTYPHDQEAFTEGLFYYDGFLYESTGEEGRSSLRKVELETGKVIQKWDLPRDEFGEGIATLNGKVYMLTYTEETGRVFDINDFKLLREFSYIGQGWGMTTDGT